MSGTSRISLALAGALAAQIASSSAAQAANPSATALLNATQAAHTKIKTATIQTKVTVMQNGKTLMTATALSKQNDANHFVLDNTAMGQKVRIYRNGSKSIVHNVSANQYSTIPISSAQSADASRSLLAALQKDAGTKKALAKAKTQAINLGALPAWRITWKDTSGQAQGRPTDVSLIIGRKDNLVRKLSTSDGKGNTMSMTMSYTFPAKPFPASTFSFKPPKGAKDMTPKK